MARLTVSLAALADNFHKLKDSAYADVGAVVKADGYGLGAARVARRLQDEGCTVFFVATVTEGTALRKVVSDYPIYVFEGATPDNVESLVSNQLTPVLNSLPQCDRWVPTRRAAAVHVDTGMQRLGLSPAEVGHIDPTLSVELVMSHFARADESGHSFTAQQLKSFADAVAWLRKRQASLRVSVTNSAGMLAGLGPEDLGRAGIGLYGGNPLSGTANPMTPVATVEAQVLQVRQVEQGAPVGYGGTHIAPKATRLATLGIGYADGIPRLLSNCGRVWLQEAFCPIVGRVSMDSLVVDVGDLAVAEGDWAELLGRHVSVDAVADLAQTLSYEVLTGLGQRLERVYVD